jgi:glutaredoxin-like protein
MGYLKDNDKEAVKNRFDSLTDDVKIVLFTQKMECPFCRDTHGLTEEVVSLSDKLTLEVHDFEENKDLAGEYGVDKIPALIPVGKRDYGIRFFGIPAGYEFASFVEALILASTGDSGLSTVSKSEIKAVGKPTNIQVFVTPTCPYCARAVNLAHRLAVENEFIQGAMVEATEFPHLATKYSVMGVPRTIVNETVQFEGALPEEQFVEQVLRDFKS